MKKKLFSAGLIFVLIIFLLSPKFALAMTQIKNCSVPFDQFKISAEELELANQINEYRQQLGLNGLTWSDPLIRAASWMSNDMLTHQSFDHKDSLGRVIDIRAIDCGYQSYYHVSEILIRELEDPNEIFKILKSRADSYNDLFNKDYEEIGIAFAFDSASNFYYWTLNMGSSKTSMTPLPTTPVITTKTPASPAPTTIEDFNPDLKDMQIYVNAKIIGIGDDGNPSPKHLTRYVTADIYNLKNQLVKSGNGYIVYDRKNSFGGIIHLGPIQNGTYFIKIKIKNMLRAAILPTFQVLDTSRLNTLPQVALMQGDINGDNLIDIYDYNLALSCFQDKKCEEKDVIDFNDDGQANVIDYNMLLRIYEESRGD